METSRLRSASSTFCSRRTSRRCRTKFPPPARSDEQPDDRRHRFPPGQRGNVLSYYETVAGGMGARPSLAGLSAVHTHMTNSSNTPAEALRVCLSAACAEYRIRRGSGGQRAERRRRGGPRDQTLAAAPCLLADRRRRGPYGLHGGAGGTTGKATVFARVATISAIIARAGSDRKEPGN